MDINCGNGKCNNKFTPSLRQKVCLSNGQKAYCSTKCYKKAYYRRSKKISIDFYECNSQTCGNVFKPSDTQIDCIRNGKNAFCCQKCGVDYNNFIRKSRTQEANRIKKQNLTPREEMLLIIDDPKCKYRHENWAGAICS